LNQELRNAVLRLIEQGGREFREEVAARLEADKRIHKLSNGNSKPSDEDEIAIFLKDKTYTDGTSATRMVPSLRKALLSVEAGHKVKLDRYKDSTPKITHAAIERHERVIQQFRACEDSTHVSEGVRRLWLLRISYEVDRLLPHVELEQTEKSDIAAAEREFARLSHEDPKAVRSLRKIGHKYTVMASRDNGLGFLLMLGNQTRNV
jgi:hypothetical protein